MSDIDDGSSSDSGSSVASSKSTKHQLLDLFFSRFDCPFASEELEQAQFTEEIEVRVQQK